MSQQTDKPTTEQADAHLRSLIALFNWLVGEVVTARIMVLRLAGDLVRLGLLPVEEINGMPLTQEIIDSVLGNFPTDPIWQPLGQRLRASLETLRQMDMEAAAERDADLEDDPLAALAEDLDRFTALDDDEDEEDTAPAAPAEVLYDDPDGKISPALLARIRRSSGRRSN